MNTVGPDPSIGAATVPSNVYPAELETPAAAGIGEENTSVPEQIKVSDNTLSEKVDEASL